MGQLKREEKNLTKNNNTKNKKRSRKMYPLDNAVE
jgi:hypothetical protein